MGNGKCHNWKCCNCPFCPRSYTLLFKAYRHCTMFSYTTWMILCLFFLFMLCVMLKMTSRGSFWDRKFFVNTFRLSWDGWSKKTPLWYRRELPNTMIYRITYPCWRNLEPDWADWAWPDLDPGVIHSLIDLFHLNSTFTFFMHVLTGTWSCFWTL